MVYRLIAYRIKFHCDGEWILWRNKSTWNISCIQLMNGGLNLLGFFIRQVPGTEQCICSFDWLTIYSRNARFLEKSFKDRVIKNKFLRFCMSLSVRTLFEMQIVFWVDSFNLNIGYSSIVYEIMNEFEKLVLNGCMVNGSWLNGKLLLSTVINWMC